MLSVGMTPWAFASGIFTPNAEAGILNSAGRRPGTASALAAFSQNMLSAGAMQLVGFALVNTPYPMVGLALAFSVLALICATRRFHRRQRVERKPGSGPVVPDPATSSLGALAHR